MPKTVGGAPTSRTTLHPEERALAMPIVDVVAELEELLGYQTLGAIVGATHARTMRLWFEGETRPSDLMDEKLRVTLQAAIVLQQRFPSSSVRVFFRGMNPRLRDRSPGMVIRDDYCEDTRHAILDAARSFMTNAG